MFDNKRFQSNESGEVVLVVGDNGVFYNLSNGANIKKDIFFQKYSEMAPDVSSFFEKQSHAGLSDLANQLSEKVRNIDPTKVPGGDFGPQIKYRQEPITEQVQAPPEYRDMLMKKFEYEQAHKDMSQYHVYENDDDAAADFDRKKKEMETAQRRPRPTPPQDPYSPQPQTEQLIQNVAENYQPSAVPSYVSPEEEAFRFFKGFKRVYPIKLSVDFDERIAEPNFLRMMVNNMEGDIIKYYTKEIMDRIYNDPGFLENKIYDKLRAIVFEEEQKVIKTRTPRTTKPVAKKKNTTKPTKEKPENG